MKAWLCYLRQNPHDHTDFKLKIKEFEALSKVAGYDVVGFTIQTRVKPDSALMFGRGKIQEMGERVRQSNIGAILVYNILSSKQQYNISKSLGCKVIDRYDLTLEIFEQNSSDEFSKLQIALARIIKEVPQAKLITSLNYRSGREHPGPKSLGEYSYHNIITGLHKRRSGLESEIERRRLTKILQLRKRKAMGIPGVCIAGYYNAGKTSLFNALTGLNKEVGPRPFTTLTSKYSLISHRGRQFFLIDTIGFVVDLDPRLIASFGLTLDDLRLSDLVLFLIDASDHEDLLALRIRTCLKLIMDLGVGPERLIVVLNKSDLVKDETELLKKTTLISRMMNGAPHLVVSSKKAWNPQDLLNLIIERLSHAGPEMANASATYVNQPVKNDDHSYDA